MRRQRSCDGRSTRHVCTRVRFRPAREKTVNRNAALTRTGTPIAATLALAGFSTEMPAHRERR